MYKKVTTYFLKQIRNKEKVYIQDCDEFYFITDGYVIFKTPKKDLELNPALFITNSTLESIMTDVDYRKGIVRYYKPFYKGMLAYVTDIDKEIKVCLHDKFLKLFKDCEIRIKDPLKLVIFCEDSQVVGGALPVRVCGDFDFL